MFPQNASLGDLLASGDGTGAQRTLRAQYGFTAAQLRWPVVTGCDYNFVSDMSYLKAAQCDKWDRNSVEVRFDNNIHCCAVGVLEKS